MAEPYEVHLVATDREVWTGQATLVTMMTQEGSIGVMPGHSPMLAMLRDGPVLIRQPEGEDLHVAVHQGFALVDDGKVIILAESAELADEIDLSRARDLLVEAEASEESPGKERAVARAKTRLTIAERLD